MRKIRMKKTTVATRNYLAKAVARASIHEERAMQLGTEALQYKLFLDAALARIKEQEVALTLANAAIEGLQAKIDAAAADDDTELTSPQEERELAKPAKKRRAA